MYGSSDSKRSSQPNEPSDKYGLLGYTSFREELGASSSVGCCHGVDNKDVNPVLVCCCYYVWMPLQLLVFSAPMLLLFIVALPLGFAASAILYWMWVIALRVLGTRQLGWNLKVCATLGAVPIVLASLVPLAVCGLILGLQVCIRVLTSPTLGSIIKALQMLSCALSDQWNEFAALDKHIQHMQQNDTGQIYDVPVFINIIYVTLTLLGTLLNCTLGVVLLVLKHLYNAVHQAGDVARHGSCCPVGFCLLLFQVVLAAPLLALFAPVLVFFQSLMAIGAFNRYYQPGICREYEGLRMGCLWLLCCVPTVDYWATDMFFTPGHDIFTQELDIPLGIPPRIDRRLVNGV